MGKKNTKKSRKNKKRESRSDQAAYRKIALTRATENILKTTVQSIEYPGGKSRESYRMLLEDGSVIATRRGSLELARNEVRTITALNRHRTAVPKLLGTNHSLILLQEEIVGERLSRSLKDASNAQYQQLISAALDSLNEIHMAASAENLEAAAKPIGSTIDWVETLLIQPAKIGRALSVSQPEYDQRQILNKLKVVEPQFVKWDSRPGNALVGADDRVYWFDWEHCGKRNRLDDMAWVMADEFVPEYPDQEKQIIERYVPIFKGPMTLEHAHEYLMLFGSFHIAIRLGLVLKHMKGEWWDLDFCIDNDKIGVHKICAQRLCQRGARWASSHPLTTDFGRWFEDVEAKLSSLEASS